MGFRFRKSISLGKGFRINISKSGIGWSAGTKGFRFTKKANGGTRQTFTLPGTGLSYVKDSGGSKRSGATSSSGDGCGTVLLWLFCWPFLLLYYMVKWLIVKPLVWLYRKLTEPKTPVIQNDSNLSWDNSQIQPVQQNVQNTAQTYQPAPTTAPVRSSQTQQQYAQPVQQPSLSFSQRMTHKFNDLALQDWFFALCAIIIPPLAAFIVWKYRGNWSDAAKYIAYALLALWTLPGLAIWFAIVAAIFVGVFEGCTSVISPQISDTSSITSSAVSEYDSGYFQSPSDHLTGSDLENRFITPSDNALSKSDM